MGPARAAQATNRNTSTSEFWFTVLMWSASTCKSSGSSRLAWAGLRRVRVATWAWILSSGVIEGLLTDLWLFKFQVTMGVGRFRARSGRRCTLLRGCPPSRPRAACSSLMAIRRMLRQLDLDAVFGETARTFQNEPKAQTKLSCIRPNAEVQKTEPITSKQSPS